MVFAGRDNAQSFVAGRTGRLDRVDLRLAQNVGPDSAEQVAVRIQGAEGFFALPTSQVLSETSVAATDVTPDWGWTSVELSEPVSVVEGQSYAIVLSATVKDVEAFAWAYTEHEAYAGGIASMITTTDEDPGGGPDRPGHELPHLRRPRRGHRRRRASARSRSATTPTPPSTQARPRPTTRSTTTATRRSTRASPSPGARASAPRAAARPAAASTPRRAGLAPPATAACRSPATRSRLRS